MCSRLRRQKRPLLPWAMAVARRQAGLLLPKPLLLIVFSLGNVQLPTPRAGQAGSPRRGPIARRCSGARAHLSSGCCTCYTGSRGLRRGRRRRHEGCCSGCATRRGTRWCSCSSACCCIWHGRGSHPAVRAWRCPRCCLGCCCPAGRTCCCTASLSLARERGTAGPTGALCSEQCGGAVRPHGAVHQLGGLLPDLVFVYESSCQGLDCSEVRWSVSPPMGSCWQTRTTARQVPSFQRRVC